MNTIRPASFRSSEKRKAKARRHSAADVADNAKMSFGFSSASGDDSPFSPGFYATSIPSTVVKRFLLSNDLGSASSSPQPRAHQLQKDTETPLFSFAYHNTSYALADDEDQRALSTQRDSQLGLFGYSCTNDSSVASPLRQINGERGDAVDGLREPLLPSSASVEQPYNIKKRLRYTPVQSSSDMSSLRGTHQLQLKTVLDTPIRSDSSSTDGHCGSTSSSTDGTVIDEWILEDQQADEEGHPSSSPYEQELNNDIDAFEASFAHVLSKPETTDQSLVKEAEVSASTTLVRDQNA